MQTFRFSTLASLALVFTILPLCAQQQSNLPPRRLNGPLQAGGGQGGGIVGRFMQGPQNQIIRVLTEAQTASLVQIMQSQRNVLLDAETRLASARKDLVLASAAEKFDENLIRTKAMTVAKLDVEMSVLRARMFSQIKPPLSAVQLENLKSAPTDGVGLRPRLNGPAGEAGGNALSLRPPQRTPLRDENDLPVATPAGK